MAKLEVSFNAAKKVTSDFEATMLFFLNGILPKMYRNTKLSVAEAWQTKQSSGVILFVTHPFMQHPANLTKLDEWAADFLKTWTSGRFSQEMWNAFHIASKYHGAERPAEHKLTGSLMTWKNRGELEEDISSALAYLMLGLDNYERLMGFIRSLNRVTGITIYKSFNRFLTSEFVKEIP